MKEGRVRERSWWVWWLTIRMRISFLEKRRERSLLTLMPILEDLQSGSETRRPYRGWTWTVTVLLGAKRATGLQPAITALPNSHAPPYTGIRRTVPASTVRFNQRFTKTKHL